MLPRNLLRAYEDAVTAGEAAIAADEELTAKLNGIEDPWELNEAIDEARARMDTLIRRAKRASDRYHRLARELYLAQPPQA